MHSSHPLWNIRLLSKQLQRLLHWEPYCQMKWNCQLLPTGERETIIGTYNIWYFFSQSVSLTQYVVLSVRLFQLASGEVSLTILMSNIVGEYRRVFYNYPGQKMSSATLRLFSLAEQCHTLISGVSGVINGALLPVNNNHMYEHKHCYYFTYEILEHLHISQRDRV